MAAQRAARHLRRRPGPDIDGFDHSADTVAKPHRDGREVIRYLFTGAGEDFRPDTGDFPEPVIGRGDGWEGERRLDIRRTDVREPLTARRLGMRPAEGFDAVEPDTMDGCRNRTGLPLTAGDQLRCDRLVARLARERGPAVGLTNDLDQIPERIGDFDFAANERCARYGGCDGLTPFTEADKAVFHAEYELSTGRFRADSRRLRLSSLLKRYEPDAWRRAC